MAYNDIIILNCEENMDEDDDTYFRINKFVETLKSFPMNDMYYSFIILYDKIDPFDKYMSGMGYGLSWDLVKWIEESPIAKNNMVGLEDLMVGRWLDEGKKAKNRFNNKPAMYDFPLSSGKFCCHEFIPDTIDVHKLKNRERWFFVLTSFNFTFSPKESKLYHLY
ncbi:hypothetical protein SUGI_0643360 [Cryptomeria japonica]|nr:hypothetical protein SUGI_0643360 [Cryptomeria japonica]